MKKKKKKSKKLKTSKNRVKNKTNKKIKSKSRKVKKIKSRLKKNNKRLKKKSTKPKVPKKQNFILKVINFQNSLKPEINFKINFSFEKYIQAFFDKIASTIFQYKILKKDEERRLKLEKQERERQEKIEIAKERQKEQELKVKLKEQALKDEVKLEKQRAKDIKLFLRKEQAILRIEQAEKQKQFLKQLRLEKQIDKFRVREVKELEKLEKISLKEKRDDYAGLQKRIEQLKEKYRIIRDQKIRERVEALGVKIQGDEDRETLLKKEKEYTLARQKIEFALESFFRSASSLVFQLNKRHITRHMSIFRCIDRRFETGEIFVKWDESVDDEWLLLIYIKNNSPNEGIVIEDKTNPEKNISHEFKNNEIFKASDTMVDSLTQLIARKRAKNTN
ncbi:conserved hypothetical protein [Candidatus Pelagibacter sp. HTCC7211]|uniref:hypothetical protein n=1 Tax=Pelagibacter sp. (strain HTCC7211) TaxID=439493 RepID=UPI000183B02E|nr:hypothetical protein [Candidatus Pelagibacter sp. HTCC7211]EDZ60138.1 conserved hypothetical protein [Candidatus Pelagibacter sp. HTCC7211]MBD1150791.1 hypothetical protein [Pelagibacterales bacterium SAG-MED25]